MFSLVVKQTKVLILCSRFPLFAINLLSFMWLLSFLYNVSFYIGTREGAFRQLSFWIAVMKQACVQSLVISVDIRAARTSSTLLRAWRGVYSTREAIKRLQSSEPSWKQAFLARTGHSTDHENKNSHSGAPRDSESETISSLHMQVLTLKSELSSASHTLYGLHHLPPVFDIYVFELTPVNLARLFSLMMSVSYSAFQVSAKLGLLKD